MPTPSRNSTINGLYIAQARKIGKRYFGQNLDKVVHNSTAFDIYIYDSVDKKELDKFQETWTEFNIILVATTQYKKQTKK